VIVKYKSVLVRMRGFCIFSFFCFRDEDVVTEEGDVVVFVELVGFSASFRGVLIYLLFCEFVLVK
jgi:hypothetical protein